MLEIQLQNRKLREAVKLAMREKNLVIRTLATKARLSKQTIYDFLHGNRKTTRANRERILEVLGLLEQQADALETASSLEVARHENTVLAAMANETQPTPDPYSTLERAAPAHRQRPEMPLLDAAVKGVNSADGQFERLATNALAALQNPQFLDSCQHSTAVEPNANSPLPAQGDIENQKHQPQQLPESIASGQDKALRIEPAELPNQAPSVPKSLHQSSDQLNHVKPILSVAEALRLAREGGAR